ncbi:alginate export family protein [Sphingomonas sp. Leaf4]|uniref:alginate export family protein n=1 Tax=Sphingomonas sp. Leaf4 TaxID=2876553 RepID=UPI001E4694FB|nr:alginate export family protein [Sphingomonas sp. Leaf4]
MTMFPRLCRTTTALTIPAIALVAATSAAAQTAPQASPFRTQVAVVAQTGSDNRNSPSAMRGPVADKGTARPVAQEYPATGVGDGVTAGGYNQSRWAEDWSKYRDPKKRDDILDRLKYIPIVGDDVYLTLSGEFRARVNLTTNPNLRDREAQRQDIFRVVGGADLHIGEHVRLYGELAHAGMSGRNLGAKAGQLHNDLVVQQSFADVTGTIGGVDVGVRYGRQTFADGPNLMVVPRDNNTIFFVYNGVRAWAKGDKVRGDVFDFKTTRLGVGGTRDDIVDDNRRFSGGTAGFVLPKTLFGGSNLFFDPFVWRLRNSAAVWGGRTAEEVRKFYGLHLYGDAGPVNLDWTVNHQGGEFNDRPISAWLILLQQTYKIGKAKTAPRVGFHFDYASGGNSYNGGTLKTSLAPFGNNIYYSYQLYATPTNMIAFAPSVQVQPHSKLRVAAEYQLSWRDSLNDAVYRANGQAFAGTQLGNARKIADTIRLQAIYTVSPRVSLTARYEHLIAGPALTDANYRSSDFVAGWVSFRF